MAKELAETLLEMRHDDDREATTQLGKSKPSALPPVDRADPADFLIASLGDDSDVDDPAWEAEVRRRVEEASRVEYPCKPAEIVFAELRDRHA